MKSVEDVQAYIAKIMADYKWPEPEKFFEIGLCVSEQNAKHTLHIERELHRVIKAHYPGLSFRRNIIASDYTYKIEIGAVKSEGSPYEGRFEKTIINP